MHTDRTFSVLIIAIVMLLGNSGGVALAGSITFAFQAVQDFDERPSRNIFPGMTLHGTYTFEPTTPVSFSNATTSFYGGAVTDMQLQLDGIGSAHSTGTGTIIVGNPITVSGSQTYTEDFYSVDNVHMTGLTVGGTGGPWTILNAFVRFEDRTNSAISSTIIPTTPPDPLLFADQHAVLINFVHGGSGNTSTFRVTSLTLVPEPPSLALGALALVVLIVATRARSQSSPGSDEWTVAGG